MSDHILLGKDEQIEVKTRISPRAKRVSIKISGHKGVELVIPKYVSQKRAIKFLQSKQDWIISQIKRLPEKQQTLLEEGAVVPIQGTLHTITHSGKLRGVSYVDEGKIILSGPLDSLPRKVRTFLIELAKKEISARTKIESEKLGVNYKKITIRDTTTRWGSCSHRKTLSFSWRLILAPKEILEYVVAHEAAHLIEMDHSDKFWKIVESINPNYKKHRKWLKEHGSVLHSYE